MGQGEPAARADPGRSGAAVSDSGQLAALRRRLMAMIVMVAVCVLVAAGAVVGYLSFHIAWMGGLFAVAMIAGFAAQIWLVVGFARTRSPR
jgi:hypothetical protein